MTERGGESDDGMVEVKPPAKGGRTPSNPELWRALMTEGVIDRCQALSY